MYAARRLAAALALALHTAAAFAAIDKDPLEYPLKQYGLVLALALLGGAVGFYTKVKAGQVHIFNFMHLVGELATSAFAGLTCFWLAEAAGTPQLVTIALVGIAGHMGTRAIALFEVWAARRWSATPPSTPSRQPEKSDDA